MRFRIPIVALAFTLALPLGAFAQRGEARRRPNVIVAVGQGEVFATPDRATIRLGVQEQARTADAAQKAVNEKMNRILNSLKKLGVAENRIRTSRAELYPVYDHRPNRPPELVGFRSTNAVTVLLDLGAKGPTVGAVLDAAVAAGANSVDGIQFSLADDTEQRAQALKQAAENARKKAQSIAAAFGVELGDLVAAGEGASDGLEPPRPFATRVLAMESADVSAPVQPGQIRVAATVEVRYAIR